MIENDRDEDLYRQIDDLADNDHTDHLLHKKFVRTRLVPIPCPSSTDLTSNKQCLPCGNGKKKKLNETNERHKSILLHLGGAGKDHGGLIPTEVTMETYPVLIDQGNLINK